MNWQTRRHAENKTTCRFSLDFLAVNLYYECDLNE